MGKVLPQLTDGLRGFIARQQLFFVATAPLDGGHVNLSPKGMDSFRVLGPTSVAYLDNVGSGNETAAHVLETDPGFTISGWIARGGKTHVPLLIEGLRKAGLPE